MRRALALVSVLALAACTGAGGPRGPGGRGPMLRPSANPGQVVATELGFARTAREKGQRAAFAEYSAKGALIFTPGPVSVQRWLKEQKGAEAQLSWAPYQIWSSCDGSVAVSKGGWTLPDGQVGYFVTVWQRQQDGAYKWLIDFGDTLAQPLVEPDLVQTDVADCPQRSPGSPRPSAVSLSPVAADGLSGSATDGSLSWQVQVAPDFARTIRVSLRHEAGMEEVLSSAAAAPGRAQ
ncbi:hypothetical protein H0274_14915 [Altererythrobacter sp. CC-YST694]|uniref:hypothetical protein n=1 Tax=Altererythrobacter sp. CC-YST694 TaxID=2755038 RepID=UPI001D0086A7|nr:hypothetical protein [Altererythrobacter sp. CC-YST694]MCB5426551.1 hypothetical protein [Altererythrobacter sp. CC-YST694]